jgi:hypothetical protein
METVFCSKFWQLYDWFASSFQYHATAHSSNSFREKIAFENFIEATKRRLILSSAPPNFASV